MPRRRADGRRARSFGLIALVTTVALVAAPSAPSKGPPPPKTFTISAVASPVGEGAGNATFTVARSTKSGGASVQVTTSAGTATTPSDYTSVNTTLTFKSGQLSLPVTVPIVNDSAAEPSESFTIGLSSPSKGYVVSGGPASEAITDNDVPAAPANLSADANGSSEIDLTWDAASASDLVSSWDVYRSTTSGGESSVLTNVTTNSYDDTGLDPETEYFYYVVAKNGAGDSSASAEASATTTIAGPAKPANLSATANGSDEIDLSWDDASAGDAVTSWWLYRGTSTGGEILRAIVIGGPSFADTGLDPTTEYFYYVVANNAGGASPPSDEANATTEAVGLPDDLEGDTSGWTANGSSGQLWHLANASSCSTPGYSSATHAFYYGNSSCTYEDGPLAKLGQLISPNYAGVTGMNQFTFHYKLGTQAVNGGGYECGADSSVTDIEGDTTLVEVSYDDGAHWTTLPNAALCLPDSDWTSVTFPIAPTGDTLKARFVFVPSGLYDDYLGWFIDDLSVRCSGC